MNPAPERIVAPHRPPRRPRAWAWAFAASQLAAVGLWWRYGWTVGLPALMASHAPMLWGTLAPNSALFGPVLRRLPTTARAVWLTIDDGPSGDTPAVLDLLDAHGAKATFFLVGERAQARPDLVRAIRERGHAIAHHTHTHPSAWFWALGPRRMRREIDDAHAVLASLAGTPPRWFRAVAGHANPFVHAHLARHGLARLGWNARGFDAVASDPDRVVARIERDLAPGAIVLLHEGARHGRSVEIVGAVLRRLDALGYRTVVPDDGHV